MSHVVTIQVSYKDMEVLKASVVELFGKWIGPGTHHLYDGAQVGTGFQLLNWLFPIVIKADGTLAYDDYNGRWGNVQDLTKLKQCYAKNVAIKQARKAGFRLLAETRNADGSITVKVGR